MGASLLAVAKSIYYYYRDYSISRTFFNVGELTWS